MQRAPAGINTRQRTFNVVFNKIPPSEAQLILAFLEALNGVTAFEWVPPSPHDYANAPVFVPGNPYSVGERVVDDSDNVYVCIVDNTDTDLTDSTHWTFLVKIPMLFICERGNWTYDEFNAQTLTAVFKQVFDPVYA